MRGVVIPSSGVVPNIWPSLLGANANIPQQVAAAKGVKVAKVKVVVRINETCLLNKQYHFVEKCSVTKEHRHGGDGCVKCGKGKCTGSESQAEGWE
jgi:hypothetical protein